LIAKSKSADSDTITPAFPPNSSKTFFLPALALPSQTDAILYLTGFAIGTLAVMAIYAWSLGTVSQKAKNLNKTKFLYGFRLFGGFAAIIVGIVWIILAS